MFSNNDFNSAVAHYRTSSHEQISQCYCFWSGSERTFFRSKVLMHYVTHYHNSSFILNKTFVFDSWQLPRHSAVQLYVMCIIRRRIKITTMVSVISRDKLKDSENPDDSRSESSVIRKRRNVWWWFHVGSQKSTSLTDSFNAWVGL